MYVCIVYMQTYFQILRSLCVQVYIVHTYVSTDITTYVCMYCLHVNIFPNFVLTLPSSMHTYICEASCVQVDPKPERASVDFGFKNGSFKFLEAAPF
jgi:hypothetical protein